MGGWSNADQATQLLDSLQHAVDLVKDPDWLDYYIIDADQMKIWVSNYEHANKAIKSAKSNFNVNITEVALGYPN